MHHSPVRIPRLLSVITFLVLPSACALAAEAISREQLVAGFWSSARETDRLDIQTRLIETARDTAALYRWFKEGPSFRADVLKGQQENTRIAEDGTRFPLCLPST